MGLRSTCLRGLRLGPATPPEPDRLPRAEHGAVPRRSAPRLVVILPEAAPERAASIRSASRCIRVVQASDPLPGDCEYVYGPDRLAGMLDANGLRNVLLCLAHEALDFVVVSHSLDAAPRLRIVTSRNATVLSVAAWDRVRGGSSLPDGSHGRLLHLLPEPPGAVLEDRADPSELGLGPLASDANDLWLGTPAGRGPLVSERLAGGLFSPPGDERPVVFVISVYMAVGGAERHLIEILRQLHPEFAFVVITTEPVAEQQGSLRHQVAPWCEAIFDLGEVGEPRRLLILLEALRASYSPALVFLANGSPSLVGGSEGLRALFADVPIVDQQAYDAEAGWIGHYGRAGIQAYDRFVAINRPIRSTLMSRFGVEAGRIDLIHHAIDADRFNASVAARVRGDPGLDCHGLAGSSRLFAFVGRLAPQKRPLEFLELVRRSQASAAEDRFVMVGSGELAEECDAFVRSHALTRLRRLSQVEDMSRVYPFVDGLVLLSRYEGLPLVAIEALAMGVPVLVTDVGELRWLVEEAGGAGRILDVEESPAARWKQFLLFRAEMDDRTAAARRAAPRVARRFAAEAVAEQYRRCFTRAMADAARRPAEGRCGGDGLPGLGRASSTRGRATPRPLAMTSELSPVSVVIPTRNRAALLCETVAACLRNAGEVELELVVIDDGSEDETPLRLEKLAQEHPNLVWRRLEHAGPGAARNLGAQISRHAVILFLGDDIQPLDEGFFRVHAELHAGRPERDFAVLGKVVWPEGPGEEASFLMAMVQGRDGEQFQFANLAPYDFVEWRCFYTANVSVKKSIVDDWLRDGFSTRFPLAAFEDAEFAYRMRNKPAGLRILYAPAAIARHHHRFDAAAFMQRQQAAGMMARVFSELHPEPEILHAIGLDGISRALRRPVRPGSEAVLADYLSVVEGLGSWLRLIEARPDFGTKHWHADLLRAVFSLCYRQGYVMSAGQTGSNPAEAYHWMLHEFHVAMRSALHVELSSEALALLDVEGGGRRLNPRPFDYAQRPGWWRWARRQPFLYGLYRRLRSLR